jgi:hypothetical protein
MCWRNTGLLYIYVCIVWSSWTAGAAYYQSSCILCARTAWQISDIQTANSGGERYWLISHTVLRYYTALSSPDAVERRITIDNWPSASLIAAASPAAVIIMLHLVSFKPGSYGSRVHTANCISVDEVPKSVKYTEAWAAHAQCSVITNTQWYRLQTEAHNSNQWQLQTCNN